MGNWRQQGGEGTSRRWLWAATVAGALLLIGGLVIGAPPGGCGCRTPRAKPWRHLEPPAAAGQSTTVAVSPENSEIAARRAITLRVHMAEMPRHLNPMVQPSEWGQRVALDSVFETLLWYEPPAGGTGSGPGQYQPLLAASWRVAPNGREIRIDLVDSARFQDGSRLSSVDVQFSLDAARDRRIGAEHLRDALSDVVAVELLTPTSLRIRLSEPNGYVLRALAQIPILPKSVYEGRLTASNRKLIGSGPYRVAQESETLIRLERWDDYWGKAPAIPTLEFVYEPDAARALISAKRDELDVIPALIAAHHPEQITAPGIASRFAPLSLRPPYLRWLLFDTSEPPLDDARVRRAISMLIDRGAIIKDTYDGLAWPAPGLVWPGGPGDGAAPASPPHDPTEAARLLDEAGLRDSDGDGVREYAGRAVRWALLATEGNDGEREMLVAGLRRAGIQLELRVGGEAVLLNRLRAGEFDLALLEGRGDADRDLTALVGTGGSDNFGRFSHSDVDAALAAARSEWEPRSRAAQLARLADALAKTMPLAPIVADDPVGLVHRRVIGAVVWNGWIRLRSLSLAPDQPTE